MMRNWFWLLSSALAWGAVAAPPERVEIAYEIVRNGTPVAEALHHIEHDGRVYQITESWKGRGIFALRGSATRTSRGVVAPDGLKPLEFADERTGRNTARAKFDWSAKTVVMQYKGEPRTEPLPPHAHDRLAFMFEFAFAPPPAREVTFDLMDGRGLSRHVYTVNGHERLKTPFGDFDTVKLVRVSGKERAEIWLATDRSYLPLRVLVIAKDGTRLDQVATKLSSP
jgi:hypothetical protein